jgi:Glu-tRNA(Gln) amidotransferase subunit E-like FAD-binding protein
MLLILPTLVIISGCSEQVEQIFSKDYGEKVTHNQITVYYTKNASKDDAQRLLDYLVKDQLKDNDNVIDIQLNKSGSTDEVKFIVKKGLETDKETIDQMSILASELSENVFNKKDVDIHLCDEHFKTLRVVLQAY